MACGESETMTSASCAHHDEDERANDDDFTEQENRSEPGEEELTEFELETLRRELAAEVADLEWEFKQAKEALFNERITQVEQKLSQAKSGTAPEFLHVVSLVEETYRIRHHVANCRRDFAIEVANKELDNELQIAHCNANERLLLAEEQIRLRLQESLCKLQFECSSLVSHGAKDPDHPSKSAPLDTDLIADPTSRPILSALDTNLYLPSPNLEPRKKPVTLSPTTPRLVYQLPEEDICADVEAIMEAVKEHKLTIAMAEMNGGKRVC